MFCLNFGETFRLHNPTDNVPLYQLSKEGIILFENLRFLDTTLRDGEQTPGVALSTDDKIKIATALDDLGVHVIEAGSAVTSAGERAAIKAVGSRAEG